MVRKLLEIWPFSPEISLELEPGVREANSALQGGRRSSSHPTSNPSSRLTAHPPILQLRPYINPATYTILRTQPHGLSFITNPTGVSCHQPSVGSCARVDALGTHWLGTKIRGRPLRFTPERLRPSLRPLFYHVSQISLRLAPDPVASWHVPSEGMQDCNWLSWAG